MSTQLATRTTPSGHRSLRERAGNAGRRNISDRISRIVLTIAMAIAMIPIFLIIGYVAYRGYDVINLDFFTQEEPPFRREGGGYAAGFFGTLYITVLAVAMAVPLGIATAIYVVEYGDGKFAVTIRFFTDVMTGIPSIFVGLFVYGLLVAGWVTLGFGTYVAAVAIAILMLPIVARSTEEMLKLVPDEWRNASYGLGAGKAQTILRTVLPAAAPGITTGVMLAVARGIGETAPLILTALGSVFIVTEIQGQPQAAVPLQIYNGARQAFEAGVERAFGGALALFVFVLIMVVAARIIGARANKRK